MARGANSGGERVDDNFHTALKRVRTYHKYHLSTVQFLREQHVPIVELDCSVTPDLGRCFLSYFWIELLSELGLRYNPVSPPPTKVWEQLMAIGRMMRPAVKLPNQGGGEEPYKGGF